MRKSDIMVAVLVIGAVIAMLVAIATSHTDVSKCKTVMLGGNMPLATVCQ